MGYETRWEPPRGVVKRFFGYVSNKELLQSVIDTESDPRFDDLRFVINDFLDVRNISVSRNDVEYISAVDRAAAATNPNIRIAVVANRPEIIALADQYANSPMNAYPTRVFATLVEARAWLGAPR